MKFLRPFQTFAWPFNFVGSHVSCMHLQAETQKQPLRTTKLIKFDGLVKIYQKPIKVSELMIEFPKHLVCHSDSIYIGKKIPALSEDDQLQLGHKYFLLPNYLFQSVLSFVTIASFLSSQNHINALLRKAAVCQPFEIQRTPTGCLRIGISDEFLSQWIEEEKAKEQPELGSDQSSIVPHKSRVCTTPQLQKDYKMLVRSSHWKPNLETVKEAKERKKLSSFGMKRKKKSKSKSLHRVQRSEQHLHAASGKFPSKTKMKFRSRKS